MMNLHQAHMSVVHTGVKGQELDMQLAALPGNENLKTKTVQEFSAPFFFTFPQRVYMQLATLGIFLPRLFP
jgi:hypothetical protein